MNKHLSNNYLSHQNGMTYHLGQDGFTLIEVIVALAIFAIVMVAVLTPLLGLFGFSRDTQGILNTNTLSQQRLEQARALVAANYNEPDKFIAKLNGFGVTCKDIGLFGQEIKSDCEKTATSIVPPLRRLAVTVTNDKGKKISSTVDVVMP